MALAGGPEKGLNEMYPLRASRLQKKKFHLLTLGELRV